MFTHFEVIKMMLKKVISEMLKPALRRGHDAGPDDASSKEANVQSRHQLLFKENARKTKKTKV